MKTEVGGCVQGGQDRRAAQVAADPLQRVVAAARDPLARQSLAAWIVQTHALSPSWSRKNRRIPPRIATVTTVPIGPDDRADVGRQPRLELLLGVGDRGARCAPMRPARPWTLTTAAWMAAMTSGTYGTKASDDEDDHGRDRQDRAQR